MADKPKRRQVNLQRDIGDQAAVQAPSPQPRNGYRPPHGTCYTMSFDGPTDSYYGTIYVPEHPPIKATAHGRRELYRNLDRAYLKAQEAKETGNGG